MNPSELRQIAIRPHSMADVRKLLEQGPTETRVSSTVRCRGRVVTMREDQARLPDGAIRPRDVLEHPGGMVMLPILDDGCVVMIRQFRYALGHALIELPAGKLDPGETPLEGAYRELAEETGYCAEKMDEITFIYTSPGFCNERLWLFRATGLKPLDHVATGDDEEYLRPLILTPAQVREAIDQRLIVDAKSICLLSLGL
ncbi:MAG: NUDIX hydrolase [Vampirovibrionales bacterium]|nr:NUDIX hydrolase [Vampirovibrionales bacterium]